MGSGSYTSRDWDEFSHTRKYHDPNTTTKDIYSRGHLDAEFDPKTFTFRESVDSPDNPTSTPIILGLDVTGSMRPVLDSLARKGMKTVCEEIYNRKPVTDPHICTLGIGDVECDSAPFQVTQFEADIRIFEQLERIYLEGGGGGNNHESYILAWYFAKHRTKTDSFAKRGQKGFIFTIGDEEVTPQIREEHFKQFLGESQPRTMTAEELFDLVFLEWEVFHVIIKEGDHASRQFKSVKSSWQNIIGEQRVIPLDDHTKLGEVIVSALEIASGKNLSDVAGSWDGDTSIAVKSSLTSMIAGNQYQPKPLDTYL